VESRFIRWHEGELLLGLVRGLALILALALFLFFSEVRPFLIHDYILICIVIGYSVLRIFYPSYWYGKKLLACTIVAIDVAFCCFLPFVSGGLHSSFILFPLTAILSVALFFRQRLTYIIAMFVSCSVIGSEILARQIFHGGTYLPTQVYVALLGMYVIIAFLIAWLPYIANLNLSATIKERTIIEERSRLSRELHDGLAQRLSSLILKVDILRKAIGDADMADALGQTANLKREMQETYLEVREIIDQLRTKMPEDPRMLPTLAQYTQEFAHSTGINCQLYLSDGYSDLHPLATVELLRVVQEALNNVKKHSGANMIEVKFESTAELVKIIIRDNGRGFTPGTVNRQHGLTVMKERAEGLGGTFEVISSPGRGTTIEVILPAHSRLVRRFSG
jgi:signal transduction histidine kinase